MAEPTEQTDDLSAPFMDRRQLMANTSAADELLMRVGAGTKAAGGAAREAGPAAPATVPQDDSGTISKIGSGVGAVAKDVGIGAIQSPFEIVKGVRDAYQNTMDVGKEFGDWVEQKAGLPVVWIDKNGISLTSNDEAKGHRLSDLAKLPDVPAKLVGKSVTGGLIKGVAQFLTGMKGAGKLAEVAGLAGATGAAGYSLAAAKGALANFAVFDPHQQRLSNLIEQFPALHNPVTEFLQSKPDDGDAEGRFKNALEGLGMGLITDGFFKGVRMLRSAIQARTGIEAAAVKLEPQELTDEVGKLLQPKPPEPVAPGGAPVINEPSLIVRPNQAAAEKLAAAASRTAQLTPDDVVGRMAAPLDAVPSSAVGRAMEPPRTFINFAYLDTQEKVQKTIQGLADKIPLAPDAARSGVRSFAEMKLDATHINAWEALTARRVGEPLADAQMLAARQLWASSADKLGQLAKEASESPSEANLFAFRKMVATHSAIQNEVLGARASIARAQASMRIPVGSGAERLRELSFALEQNGGNEVARELAKAIDGMAKAGLISELGEAAQKGAMARTMDAAKEAWTLGMLTSPKTHLRNVLSNTLFMPMQVAERRVAAGFASFLGDETSVQAGEASAQWFGAKAGTADLMRYYSKMLRARIGLGTESVDDVLATHPILETGLRGTEKLDLPPRAISSESLQIPEDSWLGRGVDAVGAAYGVTSNALTAEDNFFKVLGYRMETHAQAFRMAQQELATGSLQADDVAARVADLISNPPENIRLAAADQALYQTFNQAPGAIGQALLKLKHKYLIAHILIPFARTTSNLARASFERTPLAPLVGQWRADLAAGGARRDLALARVSVGSMVTMAVIDATMSGQITGRGPVDPGQRQAWAREGWKPYTIKIGDQWMTYNGLSPIGDQIGMAADLAETAMHGHSELVEGKDMENLTLASIAAVSGTVMNKSYLSGFANFIDAIHDPQGGGAAYFARQFVGSFVPAGVNAVEGAADPNVRAVNSMMDAIRARIPGMSDALPIRRDLWGEPMRNTSGLGVPFDVLSPVFTQKPTPEPIDKEIIRLGSNVQMPPSSTSFDGVSVDLKRYPEAYERYVQLAGNELKHPAWGVGAKDMLNQVVSGTHPLSAVYQIRSDGPEGGKDVFIRDTIRQYRELARKQLLEEYPALASEVRDKQAKQRQLRMPVLNQG